MLAQRIRDTGGAQPAGQWLFCPMLDDHTAADRSLDRVRHCLWSNKSNRAGWRAFLGLEPGCDVVPPGSVPSRRLDLAGLPPTWIGTGTVELFYREDVSYARALEAAGVDITLDEVAGAPHAFELIGDRTPVSRSYIRRSRRWLATTLGVPAAEQPR